MNGVQIPLGEIADINYTRGAQMIRSENTFLVGYVIFDKQLKTKLKWMWLRTLIKY